MHKPIFIQVYIATHNRLDFLMECVDSVLKQDYNFFEVIVSDNSTNDDTEVILSNFNHSKLTYKRRKACTATEHFNIMIQEATADYFMMFHDDDVMMPNMLKTYSEYIEIYSSQKLLAIGSNAFKIKKNKKTEQKFRRGLKEELLIPNQNHLTELYLTKNNIVPFPSYIYSKRVKEKGVVFNGELCGKYADVSMLLDITCLGIILNIPEVLMHYRTHYNNASRNNDFVNRGRLIKYMIRITSFDSNHPLIIRYRLLNIYNELITEYYRQDQVKLMPFKKIKRMVKLFFYYKEYDFIFKLIILQTINLLKGKK